MNVKFFESIHMTYSIVIAGLLGIYARVSISHAIL